jgi:hypothetical protein
LTAGKTTFDAYAEIDDSGLIQVVIDDRMPYDNYWVIYCIGSSADQSCPMVGLNEQNVFSKTQKRCL